MKKYISIFAISLGMYCANAQEIIDGLRYSQTDMNGTARFRAMSGAFGALGGDLSAVSINPASSVVFANNQVALTVNNYFTKNDSNFFGTNTSQKNNSFDLNQAGGVFVFDNEDKSSSWKRFAVSLNYNKLNNFDSKMFIAGTNENRSIAEYFLFYANPNQYRDGIRLATLQNADFSDLNFEDQQAQLGYQAYIIDPKPLASDPGNYNNPDIKNYTSGVLAGKYYQEKSTINTGYNGKLSFNASAQYEDNLMIGLNLNSHFTDYTSSSRFYESNNNNTTTADYVKKVYFNNDLHTYGSGFSFQIGAIYKVTKELRLGVVYDSPTWMRLNDELTQSASSISGNINSTLPEDVYNPNVTIIYDPYTLQTPDKWTFSAAYVFGKKGLISFDYSTKNYASMQFNPENDAHFKVVNTNASTYLDNATEYRIGVERKIKQWSLRGGYRFEGSPYKDKNIMGNLTGYSAGFGYNFDGTKLDFAYSSASRNYGDQLFSAGLTDRASAKTKNNNFTVTLTFEL